MPTFVLISNEGYLQANILTFKLKYFTLDASGKVTLYNHLLEPFSFCLINHAYMSSVRIEQNNLFILSGTYKVQHEENKIKHA